jgi:hypothetical protein
MLDGAMSADENRPLRPSSRPVDKADLPAGPARDLRDMIYQLYAQAGCPRLEDLAEVIAADDTLPAAPKKDLIGKVIAGDTLATQQDCIAVAVALARESTSLADTIRQFWSAARTGSPPTPPDVEEPAPSLGRPISDCDPIALEVHHAIDVPHSGTQLSPLPAYVHRAHDQQLHQIAARVLAGTSRMITLVGGSSTGKTRACWELAQHLVLQRHSTGDTHR